MSRKACMRAFLFCSLQLLQQWTYNPENSWAYYPAKVSTYGGDGFILDLFTDFERTRSALDELKTFLWIDRGTRAIFIDFTLYNANINLFCAVKLITEFPATGGVVTSWDIRTVKLLRYVTAFDFCILTLEGVFCAFILYYIVEEALEIYRHRYNYFRGFWNVLDVAIIVISLCCIGFNIYRQVVIDQKLTQYITSTNKYVEFDFLSFSQCRFNDTIAVLVFVSWIKTFKYINFNKTMSQLSTTISRCSHDIGSFALMFSIFYLAYAQLGYIVFGGEDEDYSTFYNCIFTLLRLILGDFDYESMEQANVVIAPLFFITYILFVFFILMNMFLAIVNDTYCDVKSELETQKSELEMADYFGEKCNELLVKLHLRKAKIDEVQDILAKSEKEIDFDEWRTQLKRRGCGEQKIETMFERHDMDGDRVLSEDEQERLARELAGEKDVIERQVLKARQLGEATGESVNGGGISIEEFGLFARRVDQTELAVNSVVTKIDMVIEQLQLMEQIKLRHREMMLHIIEDTNKMSDESDLEKRKKIEKKIQRELDRFDFDTGHVEEEC